jgi:hypothetical protein
MPPFSHLRSDYHLNLTLLERPYARALKQSYRAGLTSARGIPVPLIGSTWWFLSRLLVDRAFAAQHYSSTSGRHCHSVGARLYAVSHTNLCLPASAPSPSESTCGLTHVRASVREFRLHIDEQLAHLVEHWWANPRDNNGPYSYALAPSLLPSVSVLCGRRCPHAVHIGTSLTDNHSSLSGVSDAELDARSALSGVPVRGQQSKSDQLKSDQLRRST